MGRIKTQLIKRITRQIVAEDPDSLTTDFTENKAKVVEKRVFSSKKLRNGVAGYATRLMKKKK